MISRTSFLFSALLVMAIPAVGGDAIKVLTYNIRYASYGDRPDAWPKRVDAVADVVGQQDIVGLQEVTHPQLEDLQARLESFAAYSIGREDGKLAGEHCSIFYRKNQFEVVDQGTFWLSETPDQAGSKSWDAAITRICSWVILKDRSSKQELLFANTHFDHRGSKARAESGKLIQQRLADFPDSLPTVLLGDFNCLPDAAPYEAITAEGNRKLVDARKVSTAPPAGPNSTWSGFRKIIPDRMIDHIFVAGPIRVQSLTVLNPKTDKDRFASDHLPVQAVVAIK